MILYPVHLLIVYMQQFQRLVTPLHHFVGGAGPLYAALRASITQLQFPNTESLSGRLILIRGTVDATAAV